GDEGRVAEGRALHPPHRFAVGTGEPGRRRLQLPAWARDQVDLDARLGGDAGDPCRIDNRSRDLHGQVGGLVEARRGRGDDGAHVGAGEVVYLQVEVLVLVAVQEEHLG